MCNPMRIECLRSGIFRAGRDIRAGKDIAGWDISGRHIAGRDIAGRDMLDKSAQPELTVTLIQWVSQIEAEIDAQPKLSADEKKDLKD